MCIGTFGCKQPESFTEERQMGGIAQGPATALNIRNLNDIRRHGPGSRQRQLAFELRLGRKGEPIPHGGGDGCEQQEEQNRKKQGSKIVGSFFFPMDHVTKIKNIQIRCPRKKIQDQ